MAAVSSFSVFLTVCQHPRDTCPRGNWSINSERRGPGGVCTSQHKPGPSSHKWWHFWNGGQEGAVSLGPFHHSIWNILEAWARQHCATLLLCSPSFGLSWLMVQTRLPSICS